VMNGRVYSELLTPYFFFDIKNYIQPAEMQ
jgi:hypothetical protein